MECHVFFNFCAVEGERLFYFTWKRRGGALIRAGALIRENMIDLVIMSPKDGIANSRSLICVS